jgi:hypothetical protein
MFMKSLQVGFVGVVLSIATAWAGPSAIQGVVKDAKGQAIKGADVRVESKDGKQQFNTVKTDAKGRYISGGLPVGVYRATLVVNGAAKASITNTKTKPHEFCRTAIDDSSSSNSRTSERNTKQNREHFSLPRSL